MEPVSYEALEVNNRHTHANLNFCIEERERLRAEVARLREALEKVSEQQPVTLRMIEHNGFVFDSIGNEPGNWQHLAFSIYTDLCEVDTIARAALTEETPNE